MNKQLFNLSDFVEAMPEIKELTHNIAVQEKNYTYDLESTDLVLIANEITKHIKVITAALKVDNVIQVQNIQCHVVSNESGNVLIINLSTVQRTN